MILHPLILSLYVSSLLIAFMVLYAAYFGVGILRRWDLKNGSEIQLSLERRTYLISTLLAYGFAAQLLSLFLFIYTADQLHPFFVGAMCAAGTLYVNGYGYPTLLLKMLNFLLAGLWLLLNYVDTRGYDYPLIRPKYALLLLIAPLIVAEGILQTNYFLRLHPNIITSCCGTLFSTGSRSLASEIVALPSRPMEIIFFGIVALTFLSGLLFYLKGRGGVLFSLLTAVALVVSLLAILSFISLYFYELPTHHCPFCLLQREYHYVGYPLYLALFGAAISGIGTGLLMPFRKRESLASVVPQFQKKLTLISLILWVVFLSIVIYAMVFTDFTLG
jgi:hypothetical protein